MSILKEINLKYSLERLLLKLKLRYSGHLMQRTDLLEKTLMLGQIKGTRRKGQQRMRWFNSITDSMGMNLSKLLGRRWTTKEPGVLQSMRQQKFTHDLAPEEQQQNGTISQIRLKIF